MALSVAAGLFRVEVTRNVVRWLYHLGWPGLILLGFLDNSVIPVPGSMDVLTIILSARNRQWWPYYALVATLGSVCGGYVTYRLARKEGESKFSRKLSAPTRKKVEEIFAKWGFGAIAISALLPPPAPMVPFLIAAGVTHYPAGKFLSSLALGRAVRYSVLAFLSAQYGRLIIRMLAQNGRAVLWGALGIVTIAISISLIRHFRRRSMNAA